jgi:uncharacterized protein YndB with AHSA1/START domain
MRKFFFTSIFAGVILLTFADSSQIIAQTKNSSTMSNDNFTMVITRTFNASIEKLWDAWGSDESIKRWWGPAGFSAPVVKIDFREGGVSLVCMRSPDGFEIYNTWSYTKIIPMKSIEFIQHFTDQSGTPIKPAAIGMPPGIPDQVPHTITFKNLANGKSELTITESGYANAEIVAISKAGTSSMLDKLAAEVER